MVPLLLIFFAALVALSDTLVVPTSPELQSAQIKNLPSPSKSLALLPISKANTTTPPNPPNILTIWPHLPLTIDTGRYLKITITTLGPITSRTRRDEILSAISDLHHLIATEGNPFEPIRGVYARSSGIVWTIFGCGSEVAIKRFQVVQVLGQMWFPMFDYGPREVVRSEVEMEGGGVASFVLRFRAEGSGGTLLL